MDAKATKKLAALDKDQTYTLLRLAESGGPLVCSPSLAGWSIVSELRDAGLVSVTTRAGESAGGGLADVRITAKGRKALVLGARSLALQLVKEIEGIGNDNDAVAAGLGRELAAAVRVILAAEEV